MRTSQLTNILAENTKLLTLGEQQVSGTPNNGQQTVALRLLGLNRFKEAIAKFEDAGLIPQQISQLKDSILYQTGKDEVTVNYTEGKTLISKIENVALIAVQLYNALAETVKTQDINSINVKLPDTIRDFSDLEKFSHDIHIALSQTINEDEIGGHVEITGVENGSIWLQVFLGSTAAVTLVGNLVWAAMVIYKKKQEGDLLAQQVRGLGIKNAAVDEIQQAQKALLNQMVDAEANHINEENYTNLNPERIERLKHSIELFSKLIEKGTEIYPALAAPEKISNLFPNAKNLLGVASRIKQIDKQ